MSKPVFDLITKENKDKDLWSTPGMTKSATAVMILASADITALACSTIPGVHQKFTNHQAGSITAFGWSVRGRSIVDLVCLC